MISDLLGRFNCWSLLILSLFSNWYLLNEINFSKLPSTQFAPENQRNINLIINIIFCTRSQTNIRWVKPGSIRYNSCNHSRRHGQLLLIGITFLQILTCILITSPWHVTGNVTDNHIWCINWYSDAQYYLSPVITSPLKDPLKPNPRTQKNVPYKLLWYFRKSCKMGESSWNRCEDLTERWLYKGKWTTTVDLISEF